MQYLLVGTVSETSLSRNGPDSTEMFAYNEAGQLLSQMDAEGRVITFAYDSFGRLDEFKRTRPRAYTANGKQRYGR